MCTPGNGGASRNAGTRKSGRSISDSGTDGGSAWRNADSASGPASISSATTTQSGSFGSSPRRVSTASSSVKISALQPSAARRRWTHCAATALT